MLCAYISIGTFIIGGVGGYFIKRIHIRYTQFVARFDKTKELFGNILAEIASDPGEEFIYIRRYMIQTDSEINVVISYLSERKAEKLLALYKEYRNQKDGKSFDPFTIQKIVSFH